MEPTEGSDPVGRDLTCALNPLDATLAEKYLLSPAVATDPRMPFSKPCICHTSADPRRVSSSTLSTSLPAPLSRLVCYPQSSELSAPPSHRPFRNARSPMQSLRLNPILNTDSYKLTPWWQYPPDTRHIYSYVCSRGGFFDHAEVAGLQYIVKANFAGNVFTPEDIEEALRFAEKHFFGKPKCFNYPGWESLHAKYERVLPLRIKAIKEGS